MGVTATLRCVTEDELDRARADPDYAARVIEGAPEDDASRPDADTGVGDSRPTFSISRFSFTLWDALVGDAPVNVFIGGDYVDLGRFGEDGGHRSVEEPETAMELDPDTVADLADWVRETSFADVCEDSGEVFIVTADGTVHDDYGIVDEKLFDEFRAFVLAAADRGDAVLFHFA